jgi:osmotically-inducible protein OsmY
VRSQLGPIEKQLDVPHVHVLVQDGAAMLHGEVPSWEAADQIVSSVLRMSGIEAVESYLRTFWNAAVPA